MSQVREVVVNAIKALIAGNQYLNVSIHTGETHAHENGVDNFPFEDTYYQPLSAVVDELKPTVDEICEAHYRSDEEGIEDTTEGSLIPDGVDYEEWVETNHPS